MCHFTSQLSPVTAPTHGGMARLSWHGWLVTHQDRLPVCSLTRCRELASGIAVTASFSQQTEDRAFCPVVQLLWLRASHCADYHVTSLLFLRVTCPCSLRTYATLKFIRSSSSSSAVYYWQITQGDGSAIITALCPISDGTYAAGIFADTCALDNKFLVTELHAVQSSTSLDNATHTSRHTHRHCQHIIIIIKIIQDLYSAMKSEDT